MAFTVALAGNPNCGKTTLFNKLTGSNQYVGNWPGVTVEKKQGITLKNNNLHLIDLPGLYSLSPFTTEEYIACDYLLQNKADVVLNIVDGSRLERNLFLTLQLLELGKPTVLAVNMMDEVIQNGGEIRLSCLSKTLGIPVVGISAKSGQHLDTLLCVLEQNCKKPVPAKLPRYDTDTLQALEDVRSVVESKINWLDAAKLLEGDKKVAQTLSLSYRQEELIFSIAQKLASQRVFGDRETVMADARYQYIETLTQEYCKNKTINRQKRCSDWLDALFINRFFALPLFFSMMFLLFSLTFGPVGEMLKNWFAWAVAQFSQLSEHLLYRLDAPDWTFGFVKEGIFGSVGRILTFFPQIFVLFLFLSLLEDSGYMARAAFLMDGILNKVGLSGRSFVPMLMGFGCTTPAVMSARTMEDERDRKLTILLTPYMSCSAKLPIYSLFAGLFFPGKEGLVVCGLYVLGIAIGVLIGMLLKKNVYKGNTPSFILELPPYRFPSLQSVLLHTWEKAKGFLIKAGTVLFSAGVSIWVLQNINFSFRPVTNTGESIFAQCGKILAPWFAPLGFGIWQLTVSLLAGLVAKEAVVTSLSILYAKAGLEQALVGCLTPASALSFLVFALLYSPCFSALVSMRRELSSVKLTCLAALFQTGLAYLLAFLAYRIALIIC